MLTTITQAAVAGVGSAVRTLVGEKLARSAGGDRAGAARATGKGLLQSKTVQGVAIMGLHEELASVGQVVAAGLVVLARWLGYALAPEDARAIWSQAVLAAGALYAIHGRIRATEPISR